MGNQWQRRNSRNNPVQPREERNALPAARRNIERSANGAPRAVGTRGRKPYRSDVSREGNRLLFTRTLNPAAHVDALLHLRDLVEQKGYEDCILDFAGISGAFTDGVVPLIATVSALRVQGVEFEIVLPRRKNLSDLFLNTSWAYHLDPKKFWPPNILHARHLATQKFVSSAEQKRAVDTLLDVLMKTIEAPRELLRALEWSVNEVTDNVLNHAESPLGGFVQATVLRDSVVFTVADVGMGILASLRQGVTWLRDDVQALGEAIKPGVTRGREFGMGNGLAGTLKIATYSGGSFAMISGSGRLSVMPNTGGHIEPLRRVLPKGAIYGGTIVNAKIMRSADIPFRDALGLPAAYGEGFDHIDAAYTTTDGDALLLKLSQETAGLGSRSAGREIRTKCINLLAAAPNKPLVLDWSGVTIIASSFADELVGFLFQKLGPMVFSARVRNANMEPLVKQLLDKAILDRMRPQ